MPRIGPCEPVMKCVPAKQVHKQIARHAAPVGLPLPPLEKVLRVERNLRRRPQKPRPVARLRRRIRRHACSPTPPSPSCDPNTPSPCSACQSPPTPAAPSPSHTQSSSHAGCRSAISASSTAPSRSSPAHRRRDESSASRNTRPCPPSSRPPMPACASGPACR